MEISFHSHLDSNTVIATKFCTWHDSCAVVACAIISCDLMASNRVMARRSFHRFWIVGKKTLVKRDPDIDVENYTTSREWELVSTSAQRRVNYNACCKEPPLFGVHSQDTTNRELLHPHVPGTDNNHIPHYPWDLCPPCDWTTQIYAGWVDLDTFSSWHVRYRYGINAPTNGQLNLMLKLYKPF